MRTVSFLGDSISTYEGYNPPGYAVFYDRDMQIKNGLLSVDDAWWSVVLKAIGAALCANDSYFGSRVSGNAFPAGCYDERIRALKGKDGRNPDIIIVYLGYNDFGYGVPVRSNYDLQKESKNMNCFLDAYNEMIAKIKDEYSDADILCGTLLRTGIRDLDNWVFPERFAGIPFEEYNDVIRSVCMYNQVHLVDIAKSGYRCETIDGTHPTKKGHQTLAGAWIERMYGIV